MINDAKRPRAQGTRKRGPRASARSEVRNVLEFRLMRMHFAYLSVRARARKVRASADQGPKLGQRNIGQRPYIYMYLNNDSKKSHGLEAPILVTFEAVGEEPKP